MSDLQVDILAALLFIALPVYHFLAERPYGKKDENFYIHLTVHSGLFPRHRWVLSGVSSLLWIANGVGAYLFWHAYVPGEDTTFLVGLIFYIVAVMGHCAWYKIFYVCKRYKLSFIMTVIFIWGGIVAYFVCAIIYPQITAAILAGILLLWQSYIVVLVGVMAFGGIPDHSKPPPVDETTVDRGDYDATNAQYQAPATVQGKFAAVGSAIGSAQRRGPTNGQQVLQLPK